MFSKYEFENGLLSTSYADLVVYPSTMFLDDHDSLVYLQNNGSGLYDYNYSEERLYFRPITRPLAAVIGPVIRWLKKRDFTDHMISSFIGIKLLSLDESPVISADQHFTLAEKIHKNRAFILDMLDESNRLNFQPPLEDVTVRFSLSAYCKTTFGDEWSLYESMPGTSLGSLISNMKASLITIYEHLSFFKLVINGMPYNTARVCHLIGLGGLLDIKTRAFTRQTALNFLRTQQVFFNVSTVPRTEKSPPKELIASMINMAASSARLNYDHLENDLRLGQCDWRSHSVIPEKQFLDIIKGKTSVESFYSRVNKYFELDETTVEFSSERLKTLFGLSFYSSIGFLDENPKLRHLTGKEDYEPYFFAVLKFIEGFHLSLRNKPADTVNQSSFSIHDAIEQSIRKVHYYQRNETRDTKTMRTSGFDNFIRRLIGSGESADQMIRMILSDHWLLPDYSAKTETFELDSRMIYFLFPSMDIIRKMHLYNISSHYPYGYINQNCLNGIPGKNSRFHYYHQSILATRFKVDKELKRLDYHKLASDINQIPKISRFAIEITRGTNLFKAVRIWQSFVSTKGPYLDLKSNLKDCYEVFNEAFIEAKKSGTKHSLMDRLHALDYFIQFEFPTLKLSRVFHLTFSQLLEAGSFATSGDSSVSSASSNHTTPSPSRSPFALMPPKKRRNFSLIEDVHDLGSYANIGNRSYDLTPEKEIAITDTPQRHTDITNSSCRRELFSDMPELETIERRLIESGTLDSCAILPDASVTVCQILEEDQDYRFL